MFPMFSHVSAPFGSSTTELCRICLQSIYTISDIIMYMARIKGNIKIRNVYNMKLYKIQTFILSISDVLKVDILYVHKWLLCPHFIQSATFKWILEKASEHLHMSNESTKSQINAHIPVHILLFSLSMVAVAWLRKICAHFIVAVFCIWISCFRYYYFWYIG